MRRQRGMTLIELVIAIVIIGIAAAALYSAMAAIGGRSADPMLRQQSLAIAEAYLEEILLQAFPADTASCDDVAASVGRSTFDDICDYDGLTDNGARNSNGTAIGPLADYDVSVAVTPQVWNGLPAADALYIQVTVLDPAGQSLVLGGYRTRY
ncbi:MAG: prepilin-type N-terminal cleavage/methylation domain-containing protein [Pseudomonas sp.]